MYRVSVRQHFDAAHYLRKYEGKCENLHGHRFEVVVALQTEELDEAGMAFDFTELKRYMNEILDRYDHANLNEIEPFIQDNPSSENIAAEVFGKINRKLEGKPVSIEYVEVWESPECCATYVP